MSRLRQSEVPDGSMIAWSPLSRLRRPGKRFDVSSLTGGGLIIWS